VIELETICPNCAAVHECVDNVDEDGPPGPGDVTMCLECGHWAVFGEGMVLREPDVQEQKQLMADNNVVAASLAWITSQR
jgi:hypothetical protein